MDNETGIAIARQLQLLNTNLESLNEHHAALLKLQSGQLTLDERDEAGEYCGFCGQLFKVHEDDGSCVKD